MSLFDEIKKFNSLNPSRWHTPGHKGRLPFDLAPLDISEITLYKGAQSLCELIDIAQKKAATYFGARQAFFLLNGSTSGIFAAVSLLKRKSKILIERNAHKAVYAACAAFDIQPVIVQNTLKEGIYQPLSPKSIELALKKHPSIGAILVTSPNYYGQIARVEEIKRLSGDRLVIVDGAHGAHFDSDRQLFPPSFASVADVFVASGHKTMNVLTQGSYLAVNNDDLGKRIGLHLEQFNSSSPSYLLMASLEYGIDSILGGREAYNSLFSEVKRLKSRVRCIKNEDFTRIVFRADAYGLCGEQASRILSESFNIYAEFATKRHIVFIITEADQPKDIQALADALCVLKKMGEDKALMANLSASNKKTTKPKRAVGFLKTREFEVEFVPLLDARGRIAAVELGVFPPCVPKIVRGERFSKEVVDILIEKNKSGEVFGLTNGLVPILGKKR